MSLTLAGYASPYAGRFTLSWDDLGLSSPLKSLTSQNGIIYGIDAQGHLLIVNTDNPENGEIVDKQQNLKQIAAHKGLFYGLTADATIVVGTINQQNIHWKEIEKAPDIVTLAGSQDKLYASTKQGKLLMGSTSGDRISWQVMGDAQYIRGMTCDQHKIYAITQDNVLYQYPLERENGQWVRTGYNNEETFTIDINQIVYANNKLYALDTKNHLHRSKHKSEGNLTARATSISKDGETVVIVGVDVCGFDYSLTSSIKEEIYTRRGIPADAILINASHTHFAPVTQKWATWDEQHQSPDSLYLNNVLRKGIIQAIEESIDKAVAADLFFSRDTTSIGRNRSLKDDFALYDNVLDVVQTISKDKKDHSLIFMAACHPVFTDTEVNSYTANANFPGYAKTLIEKQLKVKNALFLQGCGGDINPKDPHRKTGAMLANDVVRAVERNKKPIDGVISYALDTILIPVSPWGVNELKEYKASAERNLEDGVARRDLRWANLMLSYYEQGTLPQSMPIYVQTINIGDWKLVALSREASTEFALATRALWADRDVSVIAYTNDVSSYLSTNPHIEAKDYEGFGSFFWYGEVSPFPLNTFETVIEKIKENNR